MLLFGGLLFLRTFRNLSMQELGIGERGVVVANVFFLEASQPPAKRPDAYRDLDARLRAMPGVVSMAETYTTPLGGSFSDTGIEVDRQAGRRGERQSRQSRLLRRRWARGSWPAATSTSVTPQGSTIVALVTKSFSDAYLKGAGVGAHFTVPDDRGKGGTDYEVIGVIEDQKYLDIREAHPQDPLHAVGTECRSPGPDPPLRDSSDDGAGRDHCVGVVNRRAPSIRPRRCATRCWTRKSMEAMLQERLMARLSSIFGGVALLLAIVGLYGVVSYGVASRRAEIGVRVALGASRPRILSMILGDVGRIMTIGVVVGGVLALAAGRAIGSLLFGLEPD